MKIGVIKIYPVSVPLEVRLPSSNHSKFNSTNIVIEISDSKNRVCGFGEGCLPPQKQLFLEDWIKAAASFLSVNTFPWDLNSIYEILNYIDSLPALSSLNPIVCAIETALLDVLGRGQKKPLSAYFPSHHYTGFISYTASVPFWFSRRQTTEVCRAANRLGIKKIRIGVGDNPKQNLNRLETVAGIFDTGCKFNIDPGLAWDSNIARAHIPLLERFPVCAIEDPMPVGTKGFAKMAGALKSMGIKLVAGRSAATVEAAAEVVAGGLHDTVSIQLSRSGGFHRSLKLINYLRKAGFDFQIGCHAAESCILSAAGHVLNLLCNDAVNREAVCSKFMTGPKTNDGIYLLSHGGGAAPSRGTGLGMHVNRENVSRLKKTRFNGKQPTLTIKPATRFQFGALRGQRNRKPGPACDDL
jgi:L-alanine-DL-glutamate epimerase-like enolase superfamily enzyme